MEIKCELLRIEPNAYEQLCKKYDGNMEMLLKIESYYYGVVEPKIQESPLQECLRHIRILTSE